MDDGFFAPPLLLPQRRFLFLLLTLLLLLLLLSFLLLLLLSSSPTYFFPACSSSIIEMSINMWQVNHYCARRFITAKHAVCKGLLLVITCMHFLRKIDMWLERGTQISIIDGSDVSSYSGLERNIFLFYRVIS